MAKNIKVGLILTADGKRFKGVISGSKEELRKFTKATNKTGIATDKASKKINKKTRAIKKLGTSLKTTHGIAQKAMGVLTGGVVVGVGIHALARTADGYTEINNRLRLVTKSENDLIKTRAHLIRISHETRTELKSNAKLYSRIALSADKYGYSQKDLLRITELLNKQVVIGGNNAQEAQAGLIQFAQGLASGKLQGDELRSVMENLLGVQQGLIIGFKKLRERGEIDFDVTRANIRDLAAEGVLSTDLLLKAVLASADDTESKFTKVNKTISGSFTQLGTAVTEYVGTVDEAISASKFWGDVLTAMAEAIAQGSLGIKAMRGDANDLHAQLLKLGDATGRYTVKQMRAVAVLRHEWDQEILKLKQSIQSHKSFFHNKNHPAIIAMSIELDNLIAMRENLNEAELRIIKAAIPKPHLEKLEKHYNKQLVAIKANTTSLAEKNKLYIKTLRDLEREWGQGSIDGELFEKRIESLESTFHSASKASKNSSAKAFIELQKELRTATEKANETYQERLKIIQENIRATDQERQALIARAKADRDLAITKINKKNKSKKTEAEKEVEEFTKRLSKLKSSLDPVAEKSKQYIQTHLDLQRALFANDITDEQHTRMVDNLEASMDKVKEVTKTNMNEITGYKNHYIEAFNAMKSASDNWSQTFADQLLAGEFSFKSFVTMMLNQMAKVSIAQSTQPFFDALGTATSGFLGRMMSPVSQSSAIQAQTGFSGGVGGVLSGQEFKAFHRGGLVGSDGESRYLPSHLLTNAPRLHKGGVIRSDEVPAILQRGEEVLTRKDPRHQANSGSQAKVDIHIHNNANSVATDVKRSTNADGGLRLDVFIERAESAMAGRIGTGDGLANVLEGRYGLNPAANR